MDSSINKEAIEELPLCQFNGTITVIEDPARVDEIVASLSTEKALGFDTETKPSFKKGQSNSISLLQISTNKEAYLFRLNKIGFSPSLVKLLANPKILKVGVGIRDDLRGLNKLVKFKPGGFIELQEMVKAFGFTVFSLKALAALILKVRVSKRQRLSNWEIETLTNGQAEYAAIDAWIALRMFEELMKIDPHFKIKKNSYKN